MAFFEDAVRSFAGSGVVDCPVPLFTACAPLYTSAMAQGLSQQDMAAVCEVLGRMAGREGGKA